MLDRWILSDLNKLIKTARESYGGFDVAHFCAEAHQFIEALSTWYVRRSRRRFYGQDWPAEKRAAYATLYKVLTTFNRIVAPVVPFMSETIYQHLVADQIDGSAASVHHLPFPEADEDLIDEPLSAHVAATLRIMSLGRSARKESKLKVRQPLAELVVVPKDQEERQAVELFEDHFLEELNVKKVSLRENADDLITVSVEPNMKAIGAKFGRDTAAAREAVCKLDGKEVEAALESGASIPIRVADHEELLETGDLKITRSYGDYWAGACDGQTVALLDKRLTPELVNEGLARDIVRNIQNLRKEADLDIADRITLGLAGDSTKLTTAISQCEAYIRRETLAIDIKPDRLTDALASTQVKIGGEELTIALTKA